MSASTRSNTGSAATSAGGRSPAWWRSAASPSVFSATVFPPVLGPLTTSARRPPRSRSIGTAAAGSSSGCRAASSLTSSETSTGAPRQPRESVPHASARSISAAASTSAASASARAPTASESSRRIRVASSRSAPATSDWRLLSSTTANGSTKRVWPEPDESWTIPGTLRRALAFTASTGPAAALGHELLLQVLAERRVAREPAQLLGDAVAALAQLLPQPPEQRRGDVAEIGAVLLDAALERVGERRQRRVDPRRPLPEQWRELGGLVERAAQREPAAHGRGDPRERVGREHAAARRELRRVAHVCDPLQRRLRGLVEQRDGLRGEGLAPRDLVRLVRRRQAARQRRPRRRAGCLGEPLGDRGEVQCLERVLTHAPSVRAR